jgi:predicted DNA-binding transcriptional regulator AlpA
VRARPGSILGVTRRTAQPYIDRDDFPEPFDRVSGGRVRIWRRVDVERWVKSTCPCKRAAASTGGPMRHLLHWLSGFVRAWRGESKMAMSGQDPVTDERWQFVDGEEAHDIPGVVTLDEPPQDAQIHSGASAEA